MKQKMTLARITRTVLWLGLIVCVGVTAAPPATDCNEAMEYGQMKVDATNNRLYVCTATGWKSTVLQ